MYTTIVSIQCKKDKIDDFIQLYEETVIPTKPQLPQCTQMRLQVDRESGNTISIFTYETLDACMSPEAEALFQQHAARFQPLFAEGESAILSCYELVLEG